MYTDVGRRVYAVCAMLISRTFWTAIGYADVVYDGERNVKDGMDKGRDLGESMSKWGISWTISQAVMALWYWVRSKGVTDFGFWN